MQMYIGDQDDCGLNRTNLATKGGSNQYRITEFPWYSPTNSCMERKGGIFVPLL